MINIPSSASLREKVCIIGSGNWGTSIAITVANNAQRFNFCDPTVNMWVYDEDIQYRGDIKKLSDIINEEHENVKYLPDIKLPHNLHAEPDLAKACSDASLIIFVIPHQFLPRILRRMKSYIPSHCRGVSLMKGMNFDLEKKVPVLISKSIEENLSSSFEDCHFKFQCGVLMGANCARDVARGEMSESTLACDFDSRQGIDMNERTRQIFDSKSLHVQHVKDVAGAELAGVIDALGLGNNTKASLLRVGLKEMITFSQMFFKGVKTDTFLESCGIADLITTCYGGRNRKCAEEYARRRLGSDRKKLDGNECEHLWYEVEKELLNGQKLQGTLACREVHIVLESRGLLHRFPLVKCIYDIAFEGIDVGQIVEGIQVCK
jgi:glycerol-3-phosphate dehydrogenase (NAD+)